MWESSRRFMMRAPPAWERTKTNENYWSHALLQHLAALACYPAFIATVFKVSYYANACVQTRQHTHTYTHTRSYTYEYADISIKAHINYSPAHFAFACRFSSFHFTLHTLRLSSAYSHSLAETLCNLVCA